MCGHERVVKIPIVCDWMSLLPVMNNCARPNAHLTASLDCQRLCGLCTFSNWEKCGLWRSKPLTEFHRLTTSSLWGDQHLFAATPDCCFWEPLHCNTRCLSNWFGYICIHLSASLREQVHDLLENLCKSFVLESGFTIKQVCLLSLLSLFSHSHLSQAKAFYTAGGVEKVATILDDGPLAEISVSVIQSLLWFFDFVHWRSSHENFEHEYNSTRGRLLGALAQTDIALSICWHYLTNHTAEDYRNWGPLFFLLGEGSEASHARDNRAKWPQLRGREAGCDVRNTWAVIMRNHAALRALQREGIVQT